MEGFVKENQYILSFKFRFVEYDMCKASDRHFLEGFYKAIYFVKWDFKISEFWYGGCINGAFDACNVNYCGEDHPS